MFVANLIKFLCLYMSVMPLGVSEYTALSKKKKKTNKKNVYLCYD